MFTPHIKPARSHLRNITMLRKNLTRRLCIRISPAPQVENLHQRGAHAVYDFYFFVPLLKRTAKHFDISEVSADKAYLSHWNMDTVVCFGETPYIPFKTNTAVPKDDSIWARMYHLFMFNRETFAAHYHKRSNVESVFSAIKAKFGSSIRSKSDEGQVNEVLAKVLCHNMCILIRATRELGVDTTFGAGSGDGPKLSSCRAFGARPPIRP